MTTKKFSSPDDLSELVTKARREVLLSEESDVVALAREFVEKITSTIESDAPVSTLCGMEIEKVQHEVAKALAGLPITLTDINYVHENYRNNLAKLIKITRMRDYSRDFFDWFRKNYSEIFEVWLSREIQSLPDTVPESYDGINLDDESQYDKPMFAYNFLAEFSEYCLDTEIPPYRHDEILAEFCNQCPNARRHINVLLEDLGIPRDGL